MKTENAYKNHLIIGMPDIETSHELQVYPNPAKDYITISSLEEINHIQIHDAAGQLIFEEDAKGLQKKLDISNYECGYYFIKVYTMNKIIIKKIIIE